LEKSSAAGRFPPDRPPREGPPSAPAPATGRKAPPGRTPPPGGPKGNPGGAARSSAPAARPGPQGADEAKTPSRAPDRPDPPAREPPRALAPEGVRDLIEGVGKERPGLAALIELVERWELSSSAITARCAAGSFVFDQLRQPDVQALLTRTARERFGPCVAFEIRPSAQEQGPASHSPATPSKEEAPGARGQEPTACAKTLPPEEEVRNNPRLQTALELFRGTITELKVLGPSKDGQP
ncbi:MAG: hypothetical protein AB1640_03470, partial [bacterium]